MRNSKFLLVSHSHFPIIASLVFMALLCSPLITSAAIITLLEDTFDTENSGNGQVNHTGLNHWNITDGSVDLLGNGFIDFYPGGGLYIDLDGTTGNAATLESKAIFSLSRMRSE
ncbi:MAG: hypothetical protein GY703_17580 [Gammaproteobacteria bacterium]|nr:hypothetical protein [Gammaproteobacteria bacterium]